MLPRVMLVWERWTLTHSSACAVELALGLGLGLVLLGLGLGLVLLGLGLGLVHWGCRIAGGRGVALKRRGRRYG